MHATGREKQIIMTFIAILPNLTSSRQCLRKLRILMWYTDNGVTQICLFRILSTVMFKMRVQVWMSCIWKGELKFFGMKCFALIWAFSRRITMMWIQPKFPPFLISAPPLGTGCAYPRRGTAWWIWPIEEKRRVNLCSPKVQLQSQFSVWFKFYLLLLKRNKRLTLLYVFP